MAEHTFKQARRRYKRLVWPVMAVYLVIVLGGTVLLKQYDPEPVWLASIIAVASALPVIALLLLMLRFFEEADEFTRLQHLRAFAWGAVFTISASMVLGFLQMFEVIEYVSVFWLGMSFFFAYGLTYKAMGGKDCA